MKLFFRFSTIFTRSTATLLTILCFETTSEEIHAAVASNFSDAMKEIVEKFELRRNHEVILSFGSTGRLYSQLMNGAPYDLFFSADSKRPEMLEINGVALPGSRFTYAIGKLVLWSLTRHFIDSSGDVLTEGNFKHLAIANPDLAPFGLSAKEFLQHENLWEKMQKKILRGENVAQAFHFVKSSAADLGFVSLSQIKRLDGKSKGSYWEVPQAFYTPIVQQAVLLKESEAARDFITFMTSDAAIAIILGFGYTVP